MQEKMGAARRERWEVRNERVQCGSSRTTQFTTISNPMGGDNDSWSRRFQITGRYEDGMQEMF